MILDLNKYRVQIPEIKLKTAHLTPEERYNHIGKLAVYLPCPVIAVSYYLAELYGMTDKLQDKINRDTAWYHLDGVVGYEPKI